MKRIVIAAATLLAVPATARADQCFVLDDTIKAKLDTLMDQQSFPRRYVELCEPCGEIAPGVPFEPSHIQIYDSLELDRQAYDLAYLYVQTSPTRYENLAMLVGCPVQDVSPTLRVEGDTPDTVLITADTQPVTPRPFVPEAVPEPEPLIATLPPPPPPAVAAPTYYSTTIVHRVPWLLIAATAGGAGFLLGISATLLVLAFRRRRAMEPRASRLSV